jgi:glutamate carboxypeptidase
MTPDWMPFFNTAARGQAMSDLLRTLVEHESPTTSKASVDRLGSLLAERLHDLGAEVVFDRQESVGDHVVARWARWARWAGQPSAERPAAESVAADAAEPQRAQGALILCHMDTVWDLGTLARQPCAIHEGRLYGPGVYDMKASIVIVLAALDGLRELGRWPAGPLTVLVTSDEERGSRTSRALIEAEAARSRIVLCMEPALSNGALKTFRKGTGLYHVTAFGRATHAGADHQTGVNAIEEMALQILALQHMTSYPLGTTLNVGTVSGGTRTNVVPERADCWVDLRVATRAEGERMHRALLALQPQLPGARLEVSGALNRPPMERDALMLATFARARDVAAQIGLSLAQGESGGGSDANFTAAQGVPTLDGLGAIGNGAHAVDEHVVLASLPQRAALLAALLLEM